MADEHVFPEKRLEMSEEEMGKIALALVRSEVRENLRLKPGLLRKIGEEATKLGIDFKRARVFAEILVHEVLEDTFPRKK